MKKYSYTLVKNLIFFLFIFSGNGTLWAQNSIKGVLKDAKTGDALIGAKVLIKGSLQGTVTDWDGSFLLRTDISQPIQLELQYSGFRTIVVSYPEFNKLMDFFMDEEPIQIDLVEVTGQRISDKQKSSPLTVESMDLISIKETPSANFYDGLAALKDVDLTSASLGFKVINTRGFNSTSPVRSLQIIDGVDNQAPGLNFSLGNFLGCSELDVLKVDLIVGASSAFYGPNAFNGVISMETKNPFYHKGLSVLLKTGERNLFEGAIRYADVFKNKNGDDAVGFKLNFFYLKADDWVARNFNPVDGTKRDSIYLLQGIPNPGRWDAVNIYGDEYYSLNDLTSINTLTGTETDYFSNPGLRIFHRTGYKEEDLVDYNTKNYKANAAVHIKLNPTKRFESPEIILSSNFGSGTTVYQGDNRFSLKNILFFQNRVELKKENKYFLRFYVTNEDAGDSYDPYFTALKILEQTKSNEIWANNYRTWWLAINKIPDLMRSLGYPRIVFEPNGTITFNFDAARKWLVDHADSLTIWHSRAETYANQKSLNPSENTTDFLVPGSEEFKALFNKITQSKSNSTEKGTRFFDKSALYHGHGEYKFNPSWLEYWLVGGNFRIYKPYSEGTIFNDSNNIRISNSEFGVYTGLSRKLLNNKLTTNLALRFDKNENFDLIYTPAASLVYKPRENTYLRASFSSALRNPTLTAQYLHLNVGRAILAGQLEGVDSLVTVESFIKYLGDKNINNLRYFSINPLEPERVKTFEVGFRTTLFNALYVDAGYYFSSYNNFLGFNIGIDSDFEPLTGLPQNTQAYRYSANSTNNVQTQGASIGLNYYFFKYFAASGNYSLNKLTKSDVDDPIIPAFNTPEHKFNLGMSGRDIVLNIFGASIRHVGFNVNYKWVDSFIFEGSPQFTGLLPAYDLLDVQINHKIINWNTTVKVGASNLLNNEHYETYGGPLIGRFGYLSILYEWKKQ
ncbi:MAG: TonB-dependent receptor [Bacteroidota bacterium]|nr:TonB-dependent receptor [Bacteroidota bacterium]